MELPPPPFVSHLLLENPWPVMMTLWIVAVILLLLSRRNQSRKLLTAGLLALVLAGGEYVLARMVVTTRERLTERTTALVRAADPIDIAALRPMFEPGANVVGPKDENMFSHDAMFQRLEGIRQSGVVSKLTIDSIATEAQTDHQGVALLRLGISSGLVGQTVPTVWLITWTRDADGQWRVAQVKAVSMPGMNMGGGSMIPGF